MSDEPRPAPGNAWFPPDADAIDRLAQHNPTLRRALDYGRAQSFTREQTLRHAIGALHLLCEALRSQAVGAPPAEQPPPRLVVDVEDGQFVVRIEEDS